MQKWEILKAHQQRYASSDYFASISYYVGQRESNQAIAEYKTLYGNVSNLDVELENYSAYLIEFTLEFKENWEDDEGDET